MSGFVLAVVIMLLFCAVSGVIELVVGVQRRTPASIAVNAVINAGVGIWGLIVWWTA